MSNFRKLILYLVCNLVLAHTAYCQATKSPFSAFGVGEFYGNALAHNQGMAGVGISNPQYAYLNNKNPALLVFNAYTVFESGIVGEKRTIKNGEVSEKNKSANLNYLAIGFPVKRGKWSTATGLMPYTNVNYKFNYLQNINGSSGTATVLESGSGGINKVFWSNGVALNDDFSIGVTMNHLFGSIDKSYANRLTNTQQQVIFVPTIKEHAYYKNNSFSLGFSFHKDSVFKKQYRLNFGLIYDFKTNVNTTTNALIQNYVGNTPNSSDSLSNQRGITTLPQTIGIGISLSKANFTIGADIQYLDYTQYKDFKGQNPNSQGVWRVALGSEFKPSSASPGSYLKQITYRTGVSLDQYPFLVNNNKMQDLGINFGLSLPMHGSSVDIGLKAGKRGDVKLNTIAENYIKLYFGVTFNDQWFIKRRFD